jgi:PAS domain S-box-containing protein
MPNIDGIPTVPPLNDLILAVGLDLEFESFFNSLTTVLDQYFHASRASISIPTDPTDIIAVPWALKAVWNKHTPIPSNAFLPTKSRENSFETENLWDHHLSLNYTNSRDSTTSTSSARLQPSPSSLRYSLEQQQSPVDDDKNWYTDEDSVPQASPKFPQQQPAQTLSLKTTISSNTEIDSTSPQPQVPAITSVRNTSVDSERPISPFDDTHTSFRHKFSLSRKLSKSKLRRIPSFSRRNPKAKIDDKSTPVDSAIEPLHNTSASDPELVPPPLPPKDTPRSSPNSLKPRHSTDSKFFLSDFNDLHSNVGSRPTSLYSSHKPNRNLLIFDKFNSLEYEKDPLIDAQGVVNVLDTKSLVLLQRKYTTQDDINSDYVESEQSNYSPWVRSYAPSPAAREPTEDYNFTRPGNEEMSAAFNSEDDETKSVFELTLNFAEAFKHLPPQAPVGCENTVTVLHIPLVVPSKNFLDADANANTSSFQKNTISPIAILSIMSPMFPYSPDLQKLLKSLSPHIAIGFMKASIHAGLTAQLASFTKSHSFAMQTTTSRIGSRRFANSMHSVRSLAPSVNPQSLEKRNSTDTLRSDRSFSEEQLQSSSVNAPPPPVLGKKLTARRHTYTRSHAKLQSYGASFLPETGQFPSDFALFSSPTVTNSPCHNSAQSSNYYHWRRNSHGFERAVPSSRLLRTIIDAIPVQVFTLEPVNGDVTWVSNRTLAYRGQSAEEFFQNPHESIHPNDREKYIASWAECFRKGESLGVVVNVRRFDGRYRATFSRVVPLRDDKGAITHWLGSMMDVHKQRKAEQEALRRAEETASDHKYKILADATPVIVFTVHPQDGVVYANNTWFNYSGCTKEETYGFEYITRIHPEDRDVFLAALKHDPLGPPPQSTEARLLDKNNEYNWHLVTYTSIGGSGKGSSLWFGTCTNINNQKLIQEKLQEAKDAAQRTIESKTRFLSNMSHEIRTPLIGISGMVSFLLDTKLSEEQLDYCHTISSSSDALLMVINDILDLSKVESGKMTLTNSWFHVRRLVEEANEFLSSMAISKSLELNYIVESDVPIWVRGDRIRLRQVLLNVIGNAIKFTDQGEVFTRCSQLVVDGEVFLRVEVIDTGRGFTTEDEHRMFKPFSQLKSMPQNTSSGTGLGLVISRQLIQLHGGNMTCKGEKGKGSTFVFTCKVKIPTADNGPSPEDMNKAVNVSPPGEIVMNSSESHEDLDILIICSLKYAAMSIVHHIRKTVADPERCRCTVTKDMNKLMESSEENVASERWTHVIINVVHVNEAVEATNKVIELMTENSHKRSRRKPVEIVLLSTPLQRPEILAGITQEYQNQAKITILYKPLKPSRYSLVFDPSKEREASQDMKMEIAQRVLENQKDIFKTIGTLARTKKHRVLLAEDNLINQKVMGKFFGKSGLDCDIATDGEDCTNKLFARESGYYDLILVSLLVFRVIDYFLTAFFLV